MCDEIKIVTQLFFKLNNIFFKVRRSFGSNQDAGSSNIKILGSDIRAFANKTLWVIPRDSHFIVEFFLSYNSTSLRTLSIFIKSTFNPYAC
jgi:hypothetical protein